MLLNPALDVDCNMTFNARKVYAISRICNDTKKIEGRRKEDVGEKGIALAHEQTVICLQVPKPDHRQEVKHALIYMQPHPLSMLRRIKEIKVFVMLDASVDQWNLTIRRKPSIHRGVAFTKITSAGHGARQSNIFLVFKQSVHQIPIEEKRPESFTKLERIGRFGMTSETEIMMVFKRDVQDMPAEERRSGVTETGIVLAFAVDEGFEAVVFQ
ncbi:hypothetical protein LTR15_007576 [Elasticomyces elasticus]|nr:hypothetical protein LTR15_007576 [Elasticomyces elasticus]